MDLQQILREVDAVL